jgi:hypothetical protein
MQCDVSLYKSLNQLEIHARGQWTMADADAFHDAIVKVRRWSDQGGTPLLSVLADLDGLILHTAAVAERVAITVEHLRKIRMRGYALVIPSYLMRMQARRLLSGIPHQVFDTREQAERWLGWNAPVAAE